MPANWAPPHETRDYDSIDKEFEISCLDKKSEDRQTILAMKTWAKPCEKAQHIGSEKTYGPNKTESEKWKQGTVNENAAGVRRGWRQL